MKTRMRFFSLTLCLCLLCSLLFCSVVNVSAAIQDSVTEITTDGWISYKKLNLVQIKYKVYPNGTQNEDYLIKNYNNLSIPIGPMHIDLGEEMVSEFWVEVSLNDIDLEENVSKIAVLKPGEAIALNAGIRFWLSAREDTDLYAPLDFSAYGCRIFLDDDYTKYLEPTLTAYNDGANLYWSFTNNTDQDIVLSRVTFGLFDEDGTNIYDVYSFGYGIRALQYRIFTDEQMATKAIQDSIGEQTEQITGAVEQQTEEHRNMFERLGDRISGFFSNLTSSISGFFNQLGDRISSFFNQLGDRISGFFNQLGDRIKGFFDDLLAGIIDGLKLLFIPEAGYFTDYFAAWDQWMSDHFGALYYPFDLMIDVLNRFFNLEVPERPTITFPAIQVGRYKLSDPVTVDLINAFSGDGWLQDLAVLYDMYRVVVVAIFVFAMANLAWKKLAEIMGGGS